jgi:hypothetical protein
MTRSVRAGSGSGPGGTGGSSDIAVRVVCDSEDEELCRWFPKKFLQLDDSAHFAVTTQSEQMPARQIPLANARGDPTTTLPSPSVDPWIRALPRRTCGWINPT